MRYFFFKIITTLSLLIAVTFFLISLSKSQIDTETYNYPEISHSYSKRKLSDEAQKYYDSDTHTVKLFGSFDLGYYYVSLFVGTPPQKQTVIVDTGSSLTAIPCSDCQSNCGSHIDQHFITSDSSSFHSIDCSNYVGNYQCKSCDKDRKCTFGISYQEGSSLNGYVASDYVVLGDDLLYYYEHQNHDFQNNDLKQKISLAKVNFTFGCTTRETNLFYTQRADGILGLGINSNTTTNLPNLVDFTFQQHQEINESLAFSLCFGFEGGYMTVGGYNSGKHLPNSTNNIISYSGRSGQYTINIHKAKIGDQELALTFDDFNMDQGSFIDSGTTMFYSHYKIHNALMSNFYSFCNADVSHCRGARGANNCFIYNRQDIPDITDFFKSFPPVSFQLDDQQVFTWSPEDYLFRDGDSNNYCLPFNELGGRVILGGIFMRHYDFLFDRGAQKIHFTRSNCSDDYKGPYYKDNVQFIDKNNTIINETISSPPEQNNKQISSQTIKIVVGLVIAATFLVICIVGVYYFKRRRMLQGNLINENDPDQNKGGDGEL